MAVDTALQSSKVFSHQNIYDIFMCNEHNET